MSRRFALRLSVVGLVLVVGLTAVPVLAAPPMTVHIEVTENIPDAGPLPFVASGPGVDAGLMCPAGVVSDLSNVSSGPPGGSFAILRVEKHFVCDDGSGTFNIRMIVNLDLTTLETTATWRINAGTDDYAALRGNGSLVGTPVVFGLSILDVYDGQVH